MKNGWIINHHYHLLIAPPQVDNTKPLWCSACYTKRISDKKDGRTSISFLEGTHNEKSTIRPTMYLVLRTTYKNTCFTEKMYKVDKFFSTKNRRGSDGVMRRQWQWWWWIGMIMKEREKKKCDFFFPFFLDPSHEKEKSEREESTLVLRCYLLTLINLWSQ